MFGRLGVLVLVLLVVGALAFGRRIPVLGALQGIAIDAVAPLQELVTSTYQQVAGPPGRPVATVDELVRENERLKAENERLTQEAVQAPELRRQNDELRDLVGLRRGGASWTWLPGRVIASDSTNLVRSLTADVGSTDGLVDGMTVMTARGLVGKIVKIGRGAVKVLLVIDASSTANAMVQRSRAAGVVYGQRGPAGMSSLVMRYIPQGDDIKVGDRVITSGLGGIFPAGVAIGRVTRVSQRNTDMFQEATLEPYVDFARLENVLVITNYQPVKLD